MCGRFTLTATPDEVEALFALLELDDFPPRYNIAPTQPILVVAAGWPRPPGSNLPERRALLARWGLIPGWAKDPKALPLLINARADSVVEKSAFKAAMRHRRVLVPASGFYEWRRSGSTSQAYFVRPAGGRLIAFAGLMETWSEPGGSEIDTAAILTTDANADLSDIHDRMPVVVKPEDFGRWLDCRTREPRDVADLLSPVEAGFFEAIPVSDRVNKVTNTDPDVQARIDPTPADAPEEPAAQLTLL